MKAKKRITNYITGSIFAFFLCIRVTFVNLCNNKMKFSSRMNTHPKCVFFTAF